MLERLKAKLIARLPSRRQAPDVSLTSQGLEVGRDGQSEIIEWQDIDEIVAARADQWIGEPLILVIRYAGQRTLTVAEHGTGWNELIEQLPAHLSEAAPYMEWSLNVIGNPAPLPVTVYKRTAVR